MFPTDIRVGVLYMVLRLPGARSLKDRRRVVVSLRDRVLHRFDVTWNIVEPTEQATRCAVVCTTAGRDGSSVRTVLDRIPRFVDESGRALADQVDVDVFPWHPPGTSWMETPDG